jgi:hypothetical protein
MQKNFSAEATVDGLMKAFRNREEIRILLEDKTSMAIVLTMLQYEDGSGKLFNFRTKDGMTGFYNCRSKSGFVEMPASSIVQKQLAKS